MCRNSRDHAEGAGLGKNPSKKGVKLMKTGQ